MKKDHLMTIYQYHLRQGSRSQDHIYDIYMENWNGRYLVKVYIFLKVIIWMNKNFPQK